MMLPGNCAMGAASTVLIALPELVGATTRTIFARGAIAWAHSTSRVVSMVHPISPWNLFLGLKVGHPAGQRIVNDGGSGMPKVPSKAARSFSIVGLPKASTIRMVCPVPSKSDGKLYAFRTKFG